jgi:Domain of Unknown Function with PDB structure (DUF3857)/Transglutaminase-like superfamily
MKVILLALTFSIHLLTASAQKETPAFGKVDKAELEMKECDFDKNAEAVVLFDVGEVYCSLNLNAISNYYSTRTEFNRHVRIKILNNKGLDRANISIPYLSEKGMEEIRNLTAQTINMDAAGNPVITKVEKDAIFHKKINKRFSEVIFTFPAVKAGSIIEYKFKDEGDYVLKSWYFQRSIPVKFSKYILDFPVELVVTATPKGMLPINMTEADKASHNIKAFTMTNVPALRDEAFISCDEDYMQRVDPLLVAYDFPGVPRINKLRTWPGIIKQLMEDEDFGTQLKKNIPRTSDLDALLKPIADDYKKMVIIYDYVRKNMKWDEMNSIWALDGVKSAWKDKKGTAGEINLILVNLLRDADIDAHPVLISTRDNGRVNTGVAGFDQFDKVMAYVNLNNHIYVMDGTDKYTPANLIPYDVVNSEGLVIEKLDNSGWGWKTLWNENQAFNNTTLIAASIDDKGSMKGNATVSSAQYSRMMRMKKQKEGNEKFIEAWLDQADQKIKVDSLRFENEMVDSLPLIQHFDFSRKINTSGGYNYFSANLFSGLDKNPFIAEERFSDIYFGANQRHTIVGNFEIPAGYVFDELPKNIKMIMPDTSLVFSRNAMVEDNVLSVRYTLEFKKPVYTFEDYPYFQEFYKKLFSFLNEQFVFKKK